MPSVLRHCWLGDRKACSMPACSNSWLIILKGSLLEQENKCSNLENAKTPQQLCMRHTWKPNGLIKAKGLINILQLIAKNSISDDAKQCTVICLHGSSPADCPTLTTADSARDGTYLGKTEFVWVVSGRIQRAKDFHSLIVAWLSFQHLLKTLHRLPSQTHCHHHQHTAACETTPDTRSQIHCHHHSHTAACEITPACH